MKTDAELAELFTTVKEWRTAGIDTQYQIIETPDETILIFKESDSKADWKTNLRFPKKPYRYMETHFYVHGGYLKEWKLVQHAVMSNFLYAMPDKPITVVGWSYGGAMATLAMEALWHDFPYLRESLRLVTFGSPRVIGWFNFWRVKERWENTTRYRNCSDFVTCVPFIFMGFHHVKKVNQLGKRFCIFKVFWTGTYHRIASYIEGLQF